MDVSDTWQETAKTHETGQGTTTEKIVETETMEEAEVKAPDATIAKNTGTWQETASSVSVG